ncbi:hypothetical protein COY71_04980, partial [Candidatus Micrarchaeota archaeon CG_4_10_14_0_8_um_filter_60_7]
MGLKKIVRKRIAGGCGYMETLRTLYGADPRLAAQFWCAASHYPLFAIRSSSSILQNTAAAITLVHKPVLSQTALWV